MYRTQYSPDVGAALQRLRQEVFDRGDYWQPWLELGWGMDPEMVPPDELLPPEIDRESLLSTGPPHNINDALWLTMPDGTHSVLDILRVEPMPGFAVAAPLPTEQLTALFGTQHPTVQDVEREQEKLQSALDRGSAWYIVAYEADEPVALVFVGRTGD
jgi:hypothetical protein